MLPTACNIIKSDNHATWQEKSLNLGHFLVKTSLNMSLQRHRLRRLHEFRAQFLLLVKNIKDLGQLYPYNSIAGLQESGPMCHNNTANRERFDDFHNGGFGFNIQIRRAFIEE